MECGRRNSGRWRARLRATARASGPERRFRQHPIPDARRQPGRRLASRRARIWTRSPTAAITTASPAWPQALRCSRRRAQTRRATASPIRAVAMRCEESPWFGTAYLGSRLDAGLVDTARDRRPRSGSIADTPCGITSSNRDIRDKARRWLPCSIRNARYVVSRIPHRAGTAAQMPATYRSVSPLRSAAMSAFPKHDAREPTRTRPHCRGASARTPCLRSLNWRLVWMPSGKDRIAEGDDNFVVTVGKFSTDQTLHAMTKVAGEVRFSLNIGAAVKSTQDAARSLVFELVKDIERRRGVTFDLGQEVGTPPTALDDRLIELLEESARKEAIATRRMPTVGHDTAMFARAGIPSAVILVRNANGSHNPDEALEVENFAAGVRVLSRAVHRLADAPRPGGLPGNGHANERVIIGDAQMQEDGTILVNLRRTADGINVTGIVRYPTSHPNYKEVLDHIGGMKPGEVKLVPGLGRSRTRRNNSLEAHIDVLRPNACAQTPGSGCWPAFARFQPAPDRRLPRVSRHRRHRVRPIRRSSREGWHRTRRCSVLCARRPA